MELAAAFTIFVAVCLVAILYMLLFLLFLLLVEFIIANVMAFLSTLSAHVVFFPILLRELLSPSWACALPSSSPCWRNCSPSPPPMKRGTLRASCLKYWSMSYASDTVLGYSLSLLSRSSINLPCLDRSNIRSSAVALYRCLASVMYAVWSAFES